MKTFYLVRHAQYSNPLNILVGRLPVELSSEGVAEANKLSIFFADKQIDKIYSSSVMRCKQTSEIISANKITIKYDLRIAETFSAYQGYWNVDWNHFFKHVEDLGGEKPQDIQDRIVNFWNEVKNDSYENIIICSHGDPLYLLYAKLADIPTPDTKGIYNIPDDEYQPKASIRKVTIEDGKILIHPIITIGSV